jgi:hypothetical protein
MNKSEQEKDRKLLTLQEEEHSGHDNDFGEGGWSRTVTTAINEAKAQLLDPR